LFLELYLLANLLLQNWYCLFVYKTVNTSNVLYADSNEILLKQARVLHICELTYSDFGISLLDAMKTQLTRITSITNKLKNVHRGLRYETVNITTVL